MVYGIKDRAGRAILRELLYVFAVSMASLAGLAAFQAWWSAGLYFSVIGFAMFYAVGRYEKHGRSEAYDNRLSAERMEDAREWLNDDWGSSSSSSRVWSRVSLTWQEIRKPLLTG